jgi:phosphatidylglycerophosphate synthase
MVGTAVVVVPREEHPAADVCASVRVAGLSLVLRAALTARFAGVERIAVAASPEQWARLRGEIEGDPRLVGRVVWMDPERPFPMDAGRCVVLLPEDVLTAPALRGWLERLPEAGGMVGPSVGGVGPLAVSADRLSRLVAAAREGADAVEAAWRADAGARIVLPWDGLGPLRVRSASDVPATERAMLRALRTPEDGPIVDRFVNRALSGPLTRLLVRTPITPNHLTLISLGLGLVAAVVLAQGGRALSLLALLLFQASVVLDHSDGEVARLRFEFTPFGKWLDNYCDHAVDLAMIGGAAWQTAGYMGWGHGIAFSLLAALGVTGSFLVVFVWTLRGGSIAAAPSAQGAARRLMAMANRDGFSLILWGTVLLGQPAWLLWILAVGANAYWVAWLVLCGRPRRA